MNNIEMIGASQQDQSAVTAVRAGDIERYRELVERHERRVYAVAWSRLGDAALAEEVTQEAFIRAYRRLWLLHEGAKFSGWVAAIARRLAINSGLRHRRELNKRERWALEQFSETASDHSATDDEPPHSLETLRQTLAELSAAHRECLVLYYLERKSGAEVAAALDISEVAVRVWLHRARAALRERLEEKLEGSLERLRPARTLAPAIMVGVLTSSSAKAATAGAGAIFAGALAKMGVPKWLLPLGSFLSLMFLLPMLVASWFAAQLELRSFRDKEGFRARLFRLQLKGRSLVIIGCVLIVFLGIKSEVILFLSAGLCFLILLLSLRRLAINRNPFFMASVVSWLFISLAFLLGGLKVLAPNHLVQLLAGTGLLLLPFYGLRPVRMDYNLFLRAAENILLKAETAVTSRRHSKSEMMAFARFLGTRWLASQFRWNDAGLALFLPPVGSQWITRTDSMLDPTTGGRSQICLGWDGRATSQLGQKDRRVLAKLGNLDTVP